MNPTRYRLAVRDRFSRELAETLYQAAEAVARVIPLVPESVPDERRALGKVRADLLTHSAGALVPKPPSAVLATLVWVVEMAQDRATNADFNTAQEALDEHESLAFVADWLEAEGQDVTPIRNAQPTAESLAELAARRDAEQEALDALEAAALAEEPGDVITDALRPYLGATLAENHADDVLAALDRAGFTITRKEA